MDGVYLMDATQIVLALLGLLTAAIGGGLYIHHENHSQSTRITVRSSENSNAAGGNQINFNTKNNEEGKKKE
jgi:hypothetical protein